MSQLAIHIVSDAEAEEADFVVCARADSEAFFDDDEFGACSQCGCAVRFRPYVPKKPPKICAACLNTRLQH